MALTTLYRAYDERGSLLYVGIATSWPNRWQQHAAGSGFYADTTTLVFENYPNRESAEEAEADAIRLERPIHNKKHNERRYQGRKLVPSDTHPPSGLPFIPTDESIMQCVYDMDDIGLPPDVSTNQARQALRSAGRPRRNSTIVMAVRQRRESDRRLTIPSPTTIATPDDNEEIF